MGLEHWDSVRRKWVLYRSQQEHGADCLRFPFESIPRRIFLDTNVVNLLVKHREQVFERAAIRASVAMRVNFPRSVSLPLTSDHTHLDEFEVLP